METAVLTLFALSLVGCIASGAPILAALAVGFILFFGYGLGKHYSAGQVLGMAASGVLTVKNILVIFCMIGMMTALWRAAGTVPAIICYAARIIRPSYFYLLVFGLNSLVSFLTGTSFGTVATVGVISMTMSKAMGLEPVFTGGAILSGIFFGDRCSAVSSSALLVCELTKTDIFENIKGMMHTALVPFVISCGVYLAMGVLGHSAGELDLDVQELFSGTFRIHWITLLPAVFILVLSLFKVPVKRAMGVSILSAMAVCLFFQQTTAAELVDIMVSGYYPSDERVASMLSGGGILSMVNVAAIVSLSSSYAGIFKGTGMLEGMKARIRNLGKRTSVYGVTLAVSVVTSMISCNQTLATMLTDQLCGDLEGDKEKRALNLEDTAIIVAPLIPWSIAGAVPIATIDAPQACLFAACYLYLIPLWRLIRTRF